ncbi:glycosyltransferase [Kluyvera sp. STS39-E]|uniref:glycosyltransferase n=1 Tax=Kluyvera sp. STS39-E TaxID=3234748 RepID=UPI0034C64BEE
MIKFSVLISVYAKELTEHFDQALSSLAEQTLLADEIILVVDGEIPESLISVIDKWSSLLPMNVIYLPDNVGLGNALNIGVSRAKYNFIARMDSDDICLHDRFEKQVKYFETFPDTDLLGGAIAEFENELNSIERKKFSCSEHQDIIEYSIKRNPFNHMTMMFKKELIIRVGNYKHHLFMEDYNLWLRCIDNGAKCHNINDVLVKARVGSGMLSRRRGISYINSEIKLLYLKLNIFPNKKMTIVLTSILRLITRLMPVSILSVIYKKLRA